ncbi:MAG TPA: DNA-processing protein DprA [Tepidisphaeraceae bacterium]|jgi:DNA processing protein|nr:DNA-processing protein DprA [Tepidisphaeraceae bacterium]
MMAVAQEANGYLLRHITADEPKEMERLDGRINALIGEIAAASSEQANGIGQVNTAVTQMDQVTQSNAASAQECAAAAEEELSSQAEQLSGVVGELVALVGGKAAAERTPSRTAPARKVIKAKAPARVGPKATSAAAAAHRGAIEAGGRTVAVIGTPLDKSYPKCNAALQQQIMDEHLVLSQFQIGRPTTRGNFPTRNRVMALISDATVIIEAGGSSGSLSQGWEALRLGRPLFIAHSVVENPALTWPEEMLHYGAYILSDSALDDLFALLPDRSVGAHAFELAF